MVSALALAACGNAEPGAQSDPTPVASPSGEPASSDKPDKAEPPANSVLPVVDVKDVANGQNVDLAGLVPSKKPVLLWAWAPHCSICAAEAPGVEDFAEANADKLTVVGIGTQDSFGEAENFVSTHAVKTPQMLWDPGFDSWRTLKITGQPTWVLLSAQGEELGRWQGGLPAEEILATA
jgi:thiol-disulfide isomerase/thioredoxin